MTPEHLRWLEAAYVYYLHPEHDPIMNDYTWDMTGRKLLREGQIEEFMGSLFFMKENDYPEEIRKKYNADQRSCGNP